MAPFAHTTLSWAAVVVKRVVFLVLGAIILTPYVALTIWLVQVNTIPQTGPGVLWILTVVVILIGATPAFLPAMRYVERATARALLGTALDRLDDSGGASTVWRGVVYYCLHLVSGGLAAFGLIFALPMSVVVAIDMFTGGMSTTVDASVALFPFLDGTAALVLTIGTSAASLLTVITVTTVFPTIASRLLGPSATDRQAPADALATESAKRNELARDLHDSVGHALTITTLQAAAAKSALDRDSASVRASLTAIENAGRTALEQLDYALRVLRAPTGALRSSALQLGTPRQTTHERTLVDLHTLVTESRAVGLDVDVKLAGDPNSVADNVSRACFRIVQEAFTNVLHHAGDVRVTLHIVISEDEVWVSVHNPLPSTPRPPHHGGRGIAGIRERALLLGGTVDARANEDSWLLEARIPMGQHSRY